MSGPNSAVGEVAVTSPSLRTCGFIVDHPERYGEVVARGEEAIQTCVPERFQPEVSEAFGVVAPPESTMSPASTVAVTLSVPIVVVQFTDDTVPIGSPAPKAFFSPQVFKSPEEVRARLALPIGRTAKEIAFYEIPAGRTVLVGKTADMRYVEGFGKYATGNGDQVYLGDFDTNPLERML